MNYILTGDYLVKAGSAVAEAVFLCQKEWVRLTFPRVNFSLGNLFFSDKGVTHTTFLTSRACNLLFSLLINNHSSFAGLTFFDREKGECSYISPPNPLKEAFLLFHFFYASWQHPAVISTGGEPECAVKIYPYENFLIPDPVDYTGRVETARTPPREWENAGAGSRNVPERQRKHRQPLLGKYPHAGRFQRGKKEFALSLQGTD
jgi:hypothetical protein